MVSDAVTVPPGELTRRTTALTDGSLAAWLSCWTNRLTLFSVGSRNPPILALTSIPSTSTIATLSASGPLAGCTWISFNSLVLETGVMRRLGVPQPTQQRAPARQNDTATREEPKRYMGVLEGAERRATAGNRPCYDKRRILTMAYRVSKADFAQLVERALDELPEQFAEFLEELPVEVRHRPTPAQLSRLGLKRNALLLGLYQGRPLTERSVEDSGRLPDIIY